MSLRRSGALPLVSIVVIAVASLVFVFTQGWEPRLGLDLQGGASVVYEPRNEVDDLDQALDDAIEIIRSRVDALGVAEPEIVRQGDAIVVNLPGIENQDRALEVIGRTAELQFRPVLARGQYLGDAELPEDVPEDDGTGTTTSTTATTATTAPPAEESTTSTSEAGLGLVPGENAGAALPAQDPPPDDSTTSTSDTTSTTGTTSTTTTTTVPTDDGSGPLAPAPGGGGTCIFPPQEIVPATPAEDAALDQEVVFPDKDGRFCYRLGPVPSEGDRQLTGRIITGPEASIASGRWLVNLRIRGDDLDLFNAVSSDCYFGAPRCPMQAVEGDPNPTGQLSIALDGVVQSALGFETPSFTGDGLSISGNFTERDARDLALVLRFGALPLELERVNFETVSPTLGEESLEAGLLAGLIGVAAVGLYMLVYYRALGIVVILGLAVWSALLYAVICYLSEQQGLALSLSGVAGAVISVGVTVDSYVVYFERLKDEVRSGKTLRSSVDRGFKRAFRTILAANATSLIGAVLLYWLTVGAVRGFAFMLGLSTVLDVVVAYFFARPLVAILGRSEFFTRSRRFGVARQAPSPRAAG